MRKIAWDPRWYDSILDLHKFLNYGFPRHFHKIKTETNHYNVLMQISKIHLNKSV